MKKKMKFPVTCLLALGSFCCHGGELYGAFPDKVEPGEHYVFYSHGYIVEGDDTRPVHPKYGVYDFPAVLDALKHESYNLIAYHRAKNTEPFGYAKNLADDVRALMAKGVAPEQITLLGFSRGGALSVLAANELKQPGIKVAILAGCAGLVKSHPEVKVYGRVLSVYETSDRVGSCRFLIDRSQDVSAFEELAISTGKGHGAFYLPREEWVTPLKRWLVADPHPASKPEK